MQQLNSLVSLFEDAAFDEQGWSNALGGLAAFTGSSMGQLVGIGGPNAIQFNLITNCPARATEDFVSINGGCPTVNWRVGAGLKASPMEIVSERHYEEARPLLSSDIYDDFAAQYDIIYGCQTNLIASDSLLVGLALLRGAGDGPSTEEARQTMAHVAPYARMAAKTSIILEREGAKLVGGALEAMSAAAFVIDKFGSIRAMTPAAEGLIALDPPFGLRKGRLVGQSQRESRAIAHALNAAIGAGPGCGRASSVVVGLARQPMVLTFIGLPVREWSLGFAPRAIVVVRRNDTNSEIARDLLHALYGLTAAEVHIVNAFLAGRPRETIAFERGVSLATIQSQLKTIYRKVGVSREVDLAARLAWLGGHCGMRV